MNFKIPAYIILEQFFATALGSYVETGIFFYFMSYETSCTKKFESLNSTLPLASTIS
jgi:hypothetical protein